MIVLKCAQQEVLLRQLSGPELQGLAGLMELSCSSQLTKCCSRCLPSPLRLLKKNKGKARRKEKRQPQNIHCLTIWTRERGAGGGGECPWWPWNWHSSPKMASGFQFVTQSCLPSLSQASPPFIIIVQSGERPNCPEQCGQSSWRFSCLLSSGSLGGNTAFPSRQSIWSSSSLQKVVPYRFLP